MEAWQFAEVGKPLSRNEVAEPTARSGEIVIAVKAAGLCHSDVGFLDGTLTPLLPYRPITLGHEIAGVVADVGAGVTRFAVGDRVAVPAAIEGPGTSSDGGFQPKVAVREDLVIALPDTIAWDQAAAATDAGLTSYHAVVVQGQVTMRQQGRHHRYRRARLDRCAGGARARRRGLRGREEREGARLRP